LTSTPQIILAKAQSLSVSAPAENTWRFLAPVASDIEQAVQFLCANLSDDISSEQRSDLDLLAKSGSALMAQLVTTVDAMAPENLAPDRLSRLRHDLRTPLTSLKGYCELLLDDLGASSKLGQNLASVGRLVDMFSKGIDDLMATPGEHHGDLIEFDKVDDGEMATGVMGGRILVVEDHAESRAVVARFLTKDGHEVYEAEDGNSAWAQLDAVDFDIVLLDHHLPDVEGNEILRRMRSNERLSTVPVIMISAGDEARQIATSLKLGAEDYIAKPIDHILLRARLSACLDRKRLRERNNAFWLDSLNSVMDLAVDGIVILTASGNVETANPIACEIFGISAEDFAQRAFAPFLNMQADWTPIQWLETAHAGNDGDAILREVSALRSGGINFPLEIAVRGITNANQPRFVAICRDATIRRAEEERMAFLARHDPSTELPNRNVFIDWINEALIGSQSERSLILVGLSGLRDQSEVISLNQGTNVLRAIAADIGRSLPSGARLSSLGNDQFGILAPADHTAAMAEALAERILGTIPQVVGVDGAEIDLEAWAGVTRFPDDGDNPAHLIRNLELAITRARREQDRAVCIFHRDMWQSYRARRTMERDLSEAIELGQLELYFQPKVRMHDFQMIGGEALLRWRHPEKGFISPGEFIPLAETTGLIIPVGQFVMDETVRRIAGWQAMGHKVPTIAINVSPVQFRRTDLVRVVREATLTRGVSCSALEIEITETMLVQDRQQASRILTHLRSLGVRIAIDDFGTGHSSLSYLAELPVDTLKIDQSFVQRLEHSGHNREIVRTITQLARSLDLETVAEGVEQIEQATFLGTVGCLSGQGYYFAKPMPADQFVRLFGQKLSGVPQPR